MPITKSTGYLDSNGVMHGTVEEAQRAELRELLGTIDGTAYIIENEAPKALDMMAADLIEHRDDLLAILTTGPRSRPKARKASGTTNPKRAVRQPKPAPATPEQAKAGFEAAREAVEAAA